MPRHCKRAREVSKDAAVRTSVAPLATKATAVLPLDTVERVKITVKPQTVSSSTDQVQMQTSYHLEDPLRILHAPSLEVFSTAERVSTSAPSQAKSLSHTMTGLISTPTIY
jgi:hypothetical protein